MLREARDSDPGITRFHRTVLQGYLVRYASNRLLIHDTLRRHPEILPSHRAAADRKVGLRLGYHAPVNLLAADRRLHSLPLWESQPVPLPGKRQGCHRSALPACAGRGLAAKGDPADRRDASDESGSYPRSSS